MVCLAAIVTPGTADDSATAAAADPNANLATALDDLTATPKDWQAIVVHHSATVQGTVEGIHRHHRDVNGWDGIGYHFVIGNGRGIPDGEVRPTYRWREQRTGAHAGHRGFNELGIGVCLIGHFEHDPPTPAQLDSLRSLQRQLNARFELAERRLIPHGRIKGTACPGERFPPSMLLPTDAALPTIATLDPADAFDGEPSDAASEWTRSAIAGQRPPSCDDVPQLVERPADSFGPPSLPAQPSDRMDPQ